MIFMSKFIYLIKSFYEILYERTRNEKIKKKIVNKIHLFKTCINNELFLKLFYNNPDNNLITLEFLKTFLYAAINYIDDNKTKKGFRICRRSTYLSYFKKYNILDK